MLRGIETGSPAFVCHFYNQYFAHTAGGLMIGKKMSDALLDGRTLEFYKWGDAGDVNPKEVLPRRAAPPPHTAARRRRPPLAPTAAALTSASALPQELLPALRTKIDEMAAGWSRRRRTRASTRRRIRSGTAAAS